MNKEDKIEEWEEEFRKLIYDLDDLNIYNRQYIKPLKGTFYIDGYVMEAFIRTQKQLSRTSTITQIREEIFKVCGFLEGQRKHIINYLDTLE